MTKISWSNGWSLDPATADLRDAEGKGGQIPAVTHASLLRLGMNYVISQKAGRDVGDLFAKDWAAAGEGRKVKDAPTGCVPPTDSDEYRAKLGMVHAKLFALLLEGYEVGTRGDAADPVAQMADKLARGWLQEYGLALGHWTPPTRNKHPAKVAQDDDTWSDGVYQTFGEALAAWKTSEEPASPKYVGKTPDGADFPFKVRKNETIAAALKREAERRVTESKGGPKRATFGG